MLDMGYLLSQCPLPTDNNKLDVNGNTCVIKNIYFYDYYEKITMKNFYFRKKCMEKIYIVHTIKANQIMLRLANTFFTF